MISFFNFMVKAGHVKKFFIHSNHFKNHLLEILSLENRGSRQHYANTPMQFAAIITAVKMTQSRMYEVCP